ncbi:hypothetical protein NQ314_020682 [Rhamnusium bicolor]|uniref:3-oxo-5-alpha-steroid 4-dehydrogenase C-terminal domain-containing protein n=1 Tax=Rhamnusium bicolor TaxID=1586634 RepID=A0AAV8WL77_9CUCU|nr:hypothetical protein NQ314_020682 [Rhamnusium bicolor]
MVQVEVYTINNKKLGDISIPESAKVKEIKKEIAKISKLTFDRQSIRSDPRGKDIGDDLQVENLVVRRKIYVKDLGPQIGWRTVFLLEYAGPLVIYALVAYRPWLLYGAKAEGTELSVTAKYEILFYTFLHVYTGKEYFWIALLGEIGNFACHLGLMKLRPAGSTVRKIPVRFRCPFSWLFDIVSCPNYTYEVGAWIGFTLLTSCVPAALFTIAGFYQMTVWALAKHRNYLKEFPDYPKERKAIIPYIL